MKRMYSQDMFDRSYYVAMIKNVVSDTPVNSAWRTIYRGDLYFVRDTLREEIFDKAVS